MKRAPRHTASGRLTASFYLGAPAFEPTILNALHGFLQRRLPVWAKKLRVARGEDDRHPTPVTEAQDLAAAVQLATPLEHGVGSAVLLGEAEGLTMILWASRTAKTPGQNRLVVEVVNRDVVEGIEVGAWLRSVFPEIVSVLPVQYAKGHSADEFHEKNMVVDEEGTRSVGMNLRKHLPGLYWLNYFGPVQVDRMGRERLLSAPACEALSVDGGVMLVLGASPLDWKTRAYEDREKAVITHLGAVHFFSRTEGNESQVPYRVP